jgi:hypothetical protein
MQPAVVPRDAILQLNTRLPLSCLDGMTEEQARHRDGATTRRSVAKTTE